jgi:hypothetical protein
MKHSLFLLIFSLAFLTLLRAQNQVGQNLNGTGRSDAFGQVVTISGDGNTIAITSRLSDDFSETDGEVQVFRRASNTWMKLGQDIEDVRASQRKNIALSDDGSIIIVGAHLKSTNVQRDGRVTVFQLSGNTWQQLGQFLIGQSSGEQFGNSVAASADGLTIAVGSSLNDASGANAGLVRIYRLVNNTWNLIGQDILGDEAGDNMGSKVDLSADGNRVAVSAPNNDDNATESGHVKVFDLIAGGVPGLVIGLAQVLHSLLTGRPSLSVHQITAPTDPSKNMLSPIA